MLLRTLGQATLLAAMVIGISGHAVAQTDPSVTRSISVTGQGDAAGPPDRAQISAGVQTVAKTVAEATQQNQAVVERIMQSLGDKGIDAKDIQTANYNIWPEQRHDSNDSANISIVGYHVSNVVNVTVKNIDNVSDVVAGVTNAGANSIQGIHFGVEDTAALEQQARADAMADARARAGALAELAGVELGEVLSISMSSGGGHPIPMMGGARFSMSEAAAAAPGLSPGQLNVSVQVQVSFAIR